MSSSHVPVDEASRFEGNSRPPRGHLAMVAATVALVLLALGVCGWWMLDAWRAAQTRQKLAATERMVSLEQRAKVALGGEARLENGLAGGSLGQFQRALVVVRTPPLERVADSDGPGTLFREVTAPLGLDLERKMRAASGALASPDGDWDEVDQVLSQAESLLVAVEEKEKTIAAALADPRWEVAQRVEVPDSIRAVHREPMLRALAVHRQALVSGDAAAQLVAADTIAWLMDPERVAQWGELATRTERLGRSLQELLPKPEGARVPGPVAWLEAERDAVQAQFVAADRGVDIARWQGALGRAGDLEALLTSWSQVPERLRKSVGTTALDALRAHGILDSAAFDALLGASRQGLHALQQAWIDAILAELPPRLQARDYTALEEWDALHAHLAADERLAQLAPLASGVAELVQRRSFLLADAGLARAEGASVDVASGWPTRVVHVRTGAVLVLVAAGTFSMGSPATEVNRYSDEMQHQRVIRKPFYLGETEVTQAQWERVMGSNPSRFRGADLPVETVSWNDCQEFLRKAGGGLRLPSEAEWEYACRAGTTTQFSFGATITPEQVNYDGNQPYGNAPKGVNRAQTVACRSLPANPWGLYEMHGNVWEWCQDVKANYPGHGDERAWEQGAGARVLRGGSWYYYRHFCRAAYRYDFDPGYRIEFVGLRLARNLPD